MELEDFAGVGKNSVLTSYSNGTCLEASRLSGNSVAAIENKEAKKLIRCGLARTRASPHVSPLKFADAFVGHRAELFLRSVAVAVHNGDQIDAMNS